MGIEERRRASCVRRRMRSGEAAERRAAEADNLPHSQRGVPWNTGRWPSMRTMRASGSCYKKSMCTGRRIDICDSSRLNRRKASWAHSGIKKSLINFARRKSCRMVRDEEMKISWQEANEGQPVPEEQYQERFWWRRRDGIELDMHHNRACTLPYNKL